MEERMRNEQRENEKGIDKNRLSNKEEVYIYVYIYYIYIYVYVIIYMYIVYILRER